MAHDVVKILFDDDGTKVTAPVWHFVTYGTGSEMTLCTGEVFGFGEGQAVFKRKTVERGGITCISCLRIIKDFKTVKL